MAFLPDGRLLVTERPGRMRLIGKDGRLSPPLKGVPPVFASGQGGLLDVALSPDFASSRPDLFLLFGAARTGQQRHQPWHAGSLRPARMPPASMTSKVIFRQEPATTGGMHFGSRLAFARDGNLFVTLGERVASATRRRTSAITTARWCASALTARCRPTIRSSTKPGARPEIWSYGHRNLQAAAINPASGKLWTVEHGARGGDEINIPQAGKNYGWPVITYGRDYSFAKIGEGTAKAGMEQPIYYWDPSIAPSGMAFYTGDLFPQWKGNLFVGALAGQALHRLVLDGEQDRRRGAPARRSGRAHPRRALRPRRRDLAADGQPGGAGVAGGAGQIGP